MATGGLLDLIGPRGQTSVGNLGQLHLRRTVPVKDIFVSYAKEDRERASVLAAALEELGWSVWWDRVIPTGRSFDDVIEEELDAARCVIVLWSSSSIRSDWVKAEAARAVEQKKLFPVLSERVSLPLAFSRFHAADLAEWDGRSGTGGFPQLVSDMGRILGTPQAEEEKRSAEAEAKAKAQAEAKRRAEQEEKRRAEEEKKRKADEERLRGEDEASEGAPAPPERWVGAGVGFLAGTVLGVLAMSTVRPYESGLLFLGLLSGAAGAISGALVGTRGRPLLLVVAGAAVAGFFVYVSFDLGGETISAAGNIGAPAGAILGATAAVILRKLRKWPWLWSG